MPETIKAMSLSQRVEAVRRAVWNLPAPTQEPGAIGGIECEDVQMDAAIIQTGGAYYRVPYTIEAGGVVFVPRDQWELVQEDYTPTTPEDMATVKALGRNRVGGYLVLWGDKFRKDLTNEYFTPGTEGLLSLFKAAGKLPMLWQHGLDKSVKYEPVGAYDVMVTDDIGLWAEGQLDLAGKYREAINSLLARKVLGQSSQSLPSARKVAPDGHIERWVIAEGSLTPTPCEPRMITERPLAEIKAAFDALGIAFPEPEQAHEKSTPEGDEESRRAEKERLSLAFNFLAIETE